MGGSGKRKCPSCASDKVARIEYGLPAMSDKLDRDLQSGKVVLGGCCVEIGDPKWCCTACGHKWPSGAAPE